MGHIVNNGEVAVVVEGLGKHILENDSGSVNPPNSKKRRISAVRDFPKGCGRFAVVNGNSVVDRLAEEYIRRRDLVEQLEDFSSANQSVELKTLEMAVGLIQMNHLYLRNLRFWRLQCQWRIWCRQKIKSQ
ncbi:hypothetical protein FRX31_019101 [Thalictrum thalictroides]|uniref:Uncharacterized protein n=1 Tax=Thalictrum thalictroides TaxID=46969 RepID=A0A7J6W477_THATH|nr:hypothetical protein FRX31_019101 [Thalictrum thalictroides]